MPTARRVFSLLTMMLTVGVAAPAQQTDRSELAAEVSRLLNDLAAGSEDARSAAKERLLELAGPGVAAAERMLEALPKPTDKMPAALSEPLREIRRQIADRLAELSAEPTRVTLDVVQEPLSEVLKAIEEQTGNRVIDLREQFGQDADDRPVTIDVTDVPFWDAMDRVLDEAGLGVYSYSGERALGLIGRGGGASARWAAACYAGPMRIEPIRIVAARDLRQLEGESLNLQLEVSWEPRLAPIALAQPLDAIRATDESGAELPVTRPGETIDLEVQAGGQTIEMTVPLKLPSRDVQKIQSLKGTLDAIAPSRLMKFRFDKLDAIESPTVKQQGGATVTIDAVRKNGEIWELRMRLKIEGADDTTVGGDSPFASHRGWVFENPSMLIDADGNEIEHAGFETTMQRGNEIGLAYLFELPNGPAGTTWVYETPTAILRFPLEYEVTHIPLP